MTSTSSPRTAPQRSDLIALAAHEGLSSPVGAAAALFILMAYAEDNFICPALADAYPMLPVADFAERCRAIDRDPSAGRAWFDERTSAWLSSIGVEDGLARDIALMALPNPAIAGEIASAAADAPCSMALFAADRAEALQFVAALCFGARGRVQAVVLGGSVAGAYIDRATGSVVPAPEGDFDAIISDESFFEFVATERRQRLKGTQSADADGAAAELGRGFGLGDRDS